ncbi:MAG: tripartite tricarboxylate transporter substrate binding protein [Lautropia sp.]
MGIVSRARVRWLAAAVLVAAAAPVMAQDAYPNRPIRIVVPFPPGGTSDEVARLIAAPLADALKRPVLVDNRPGANAILGTQAVASSPADGYTLGLFPSGHAITGSLRKLPYDAEASFAPVVLIGSVPLLAVVSAQSHAANFGDVLTRARQNPGKVSYKSGGVGASDHLATELLANTAGVELLNVPYKGDPPAAVDLVANQIDFGLFNVSSVIQLVRGGKLKAVGSTSDQRSALLPDVPTLKEQGVDSYTAGSWHAIFAPAGTPPEIVRTLNQTINRTIERPEIATRLRDLGITIEGGPPERLGSFLQVEVAKWARVIRDAGIKPEN